MLTMADIEFTGERFIPGATGDLVYEHWHRYAFARRFAAGKRVLDAACGEGYGTALLAAVATEAIGVDIDEAAVAHARANYAGRGNLRFESGSVTALPLADASLDIVISFETIEHLPAADQPRMLAEFARVLASGGVLLLSSPNKRRYSDARNYHNPFHLHELYRDELAQLLDFGFPHRRWFHQTRSYMSTLWSEDLTGANAGCEAWTGDADTVVPTSAPDGLYYVVIAAASVEALPATGPQLSLFADRDDSELKRAEAIAHEVLRLDRLLKERDAGLDRQMAHIGHLEKLVAERERIVVERDAQLVAVNAVRASHEQALLAERPVWEKAKDALARCESELSTVRKTMTALQGEQRSLAAAVAAQERIITHRQTLRWWVQLPWLRAKRSWQQWWGQ